LQSCQIKEEEGKKKKKIPKTTTKIAIIKNAKVSDFSTAKRRLKKKKPLESWGETAELLKQTLRVS